MDYQGSRETSVGKDTQGLSEDNAAGRGAVSGQIVYLTPDANNLVVLPPEVFLDDLQVVGRDLVIVADDGTRYVIQNGAVDVPQLVVEGVEVPPLNLAALLVGNEPEPAAGATQSSGGNFADPAGDIQDAYDRGDLLPYTELSFPEPEEQEIYQGVDNEPEVIIITQDNPVGAIDATDSVDEDGLPARDGEPEGTQAATDSEITTGTISYVSLDGTDAVTINGIEVVSVGQEIPGTYGVLTITSIADGTIGYSYRLLDNTSGSGTSDVFEVTVVDTDGDTATATLTVAIADDAPIALDDTDTVDIETDTATGNVITGAATVTGAAGADTVGADDASISAISGAGGSDDSFNESGYLEVTGEHGTLLIDADGNYEYTPFENSQGGATDEFEYTLTDGDGSEATATLTITLIDLQPVVGENGLVQLDDDALAGGNPGGIGDDADGINTSGTLSGSGGNGALTFALTGATLPAGFTVSSNNGSVMIISQGGTDVLQVSINAATGDYSVTQLNPIDHLAGNDENNFDFAVQYSVTDIDGDSADGTLDINVDDDTPTAEDDTDSLDEGGPISTDGNVISGAGTDSGAAGADTVGADGAEVSNPGSYDGTYGTLVLNADGSYTYTLTDFGQSMIETLGDGETLTDSFDYTLVDGDGDSDPATLTLTLNGSDDEVTITGLESTAPDIVLDEDDLANAGDDQGSDQSDPVTVNGNFGVTSPDGLDLVQVNTINVVVGGVFGGPVEVANDGIIAISITGWTPTYAADGTTVISATFEYSATLLDNTLAHTGDYNDAIFDRLQVAASDEDGSADFEYLYYGIVDDEPTAEDDTDSLDEGGPISTDGNVISGAGTDSGAAGADTVGADGAEVGNPGSYDGTYGTLVLNADGSYTYTLTDFGQSMIETLGDGETLTDSFDYTLVDGDGDSDPATLTLTLNGSDDEVTITGINTGTPDVVLDEDDLANAGDDQGSDQSDPVTVNGNFQVTSPDGLDLVEVSGVGVVAGGVFGGPVEVLNDGVMSISITGWTPTYAADGTTVISATFDFSATLLDNTLAHTGDYNDAIFDRLLVAASDDDGSADFEYLYYGIVDDEPSAEDDTDSIAAGEYGPVTGNVVTDAEANGDNGADTVGADGFASITNLVSDNIPANSDADPAGGFVVQGEYGVLTVQANGDYSYTRDPNTRGGVEDSFTYTFQDGDGDEASATLTISIGNAPPEIGGLTPKAEGGDVIVDEDDLANAGDDQGSDPTKESTTQGGTFTITAPDGVDDLVIDGHTVIDGGVFTAESWTTALGNTLSITGYNTATGVVTYTYTLEDNETHADGLDENALFEDFAVTLTDLDGQSANDTLTAQIADDVPSPENDVFNQTAENADVSGDVSLNDASGADGAASFALVGAVSGTGSLDFNDDGTFTYTPGAGETGQVTFQYSITDDDNDVRNANVTINLVADSAPVAADVNAYLDDDGLPAGNADSTAGDDDANAGETGSGTSSEAIWTGTLGVTNAPADTPLTYTLLLPADGTIGTENVTYSLNAGATLLTATVDGGDRDGMTLFTVEITDQASGAYTVTLINAVMHPYTTDTENNVTAAISYQVADSDPTPDTDTGTITINFDDDMPSVFTPEDASVQNAAGDPVVFQLDSAPGDGNILNNFGADGPGTVRFPSSIDGTDSGLTSGGQPIIYELGPDGETLYGKVGGTVIFTVEIDAENSTYSVDMDGKVDAVTNIEFNPDDYDLIGGAKGWFGIGQDGDNDSSDLLITPGDGERVNTSEILGGVGDQNATGPGEFFRIDYVTDLAGSPPNTYDLGAENGHSFDGHYTTQGATINFRQSGGTTLKFTASDDADGDNIVGDGAIDTITGITLSYNGVTSTLLTPTGAPQMVTLDGHQFTYYMDADGQSVIVEGIAGASGNSGGAETQVAIFTADGYNSLLVTHEGGESVKFSGFGAAVPTQEPVDFSIPTEIVDADGDTVAGQDIDITLTPSVEPLFLVGSSEDDANGETENHIVGKPGGPYEGDITGDTGDDVIVGDPGAVTISAGQTANVVLALDTSGSMDGQISFDGGVTDRLQAMKDGTNALIDSLASSGAEDVRITLIPFSTNATNLGTFDLIVDGVVNTAAVDAAKAAINSFDHDGWTNYEAAIQATEDWITGGNGIAGADINKVVFVSDGSPTASINNSGGVVTDNNSSRNMSELLGTYNPGGTSNDDFVNDVQAVLNTGYTINAIGINVGATAIGYLSDVEDGIAGGGDGSAQNVTTAEQLAETLAVLGESTELADAGDDTIVGGDGNELIFGDVLFTDDLANDVNPGVNLPDGSGWAVFQALENRADAENTDPAGDGADWTRADTVAYIKANAATLATESGRAGGNDTINAGAGNDTIFGQEGNDVITGGAGFDTISGGSGSDTFVFDADALSDGSFDTITDYTAGEVIDLTAILPDFALGDLADYVQYDDVSGELFVDLDGGAGGENWVKIAELENSGSPYGGDVTVRASIGGSDSNVISPAVPPIVLDLDGDGVEFVGTDAGVTYDYGNGLVATAWAGADDGILAIDANGDGKVTDASEFVFGGNGLSDLQGLAANFDSNGDGVLDASDDAFAQFGVWQDANQDGVADAGEFQTLSDLGITSIGLTSDGNAYSAADGDVEVLGTATYTRADGTTGEAADAIFSTKAVARETEIALAAAFGGVLTTAPQDGLQFLMLDGEGNAQTEERWTSEETSYSVLSESETQEESRSTAEYESREVSESETAQESDFHSDESETQDSASLDSMAAQDDGSDFDTGDQTDGGDTEQFLAFDASSEDAAMMDALLSLGEGEGEEANAQTDQTVTKEALDEVAEGEQVDQILDQLVGEEQPHAEAAPNSDTEALLGTQLTDDSLHFNTFDANAQADDDASLAAAVAA